MKLAIRNLCLLLVISWCVMTTTHECGHLVGGWLSGATLTKYDLCPWHLPYSMHQPDPHPLVTLWSGPILGVFAPLIVFFLRPNPFLKGVAGFSLLANGVYLGAGLLSNDSFLDTTRLIREGAWQGTIILYSLLCSVSGYILLRQAIITLSAPHNTASPATPPETDVKQDPDSAD